MPELIQTLKAYNKRESNSRRFTASLNGVDLDIDEEQEGPSFDDIERKALGINASGDDVVSLQGRLAAQAGFGIGEGLGYAKE